MKFVPTRAKIGKVPSLREVEAAMTRSTSRRAGHLGRRPREDLAVERMVDTWENVWGTKLELEEISYWRFLGKDGVALEMDQGGRRRAFDGGSTRYMPRVEGSDTLSQISDETDMIHSGKSGFFALLRRLGVASVAAVGVMAVSLSKW